MHDVIVIGAGMGGLLCAAKAARNGRRVLVIEKRPRAGGTCGVFERKGYRFPMGPLSFGFPRKVQALLEEAGVSGAIGFAPSRFRLLAPGLDIVYSRPLAAVRKDLAAVFPREAAGIEKFFEEFEAVIGSVRDIHDWHPDYSPGRRPEKADERASPELARRMDQIKEWASSPAAGPIGRHLSSPALKNFLGSMGTHEAEMSILNLALMWRLMSEVGIWFPSGGIHGLAERLRAGFLASGGELRLSTAVKKIVVEKGRAAGVLTATDEFFPCRWVVSNADFKRTILDFLDPAEVPAGFLESVRAVPYTDSEFCAYLGIDPRKVDLRRLSAGHVFFRKEIRPISGTPLEDFDNREIEVCFWSRKAAGLAPPGKASIVLRVGFPYEHFSEWKTGEKMRRPGYGEYKKQMAAQLIRTVDSLLPGLSSAVEVLETATPLTYEDWGNRFRGSIAGWTWTAEGAGRFPRKLLVETPVGGLLMAGVYASTELFLGGVPTALYTGSAAADRILSEEGG